MSENIEREIKKFLSHRSSTRPLKSFFSGTK